LKRLQVSLAAGLAVLALGAAACGGDEGSATAGEGGSGGEVSLVAFSTPAEAYAEIIEKFQATPEGEGVEFKESYGASGDQSRAVEAGLAADYVHFSLAPDMNRLVEASMVDAGWADGANEGIAARSVVVFAVRKGNPENIQTWDDLLRDGIEVITPNPFTSGGARWNVMAAYGAQRELGKSHEEAVEYLMDLFQHVSVQDDSARDALQTFAGGKGDVLLAYENEAILAQQKGEDVDYVIPDETLLIETPAAVTSDASPAAKAFLEYVLSPEAQEVFAKNGYRPVDESVAASADFAEPADLFTIEDVGGWEKVMTDFFDPEESIMADVERSIGVSTGG
jgi:sulfate/thiosulfate transport system substrate-binding protein